ncbi:MAG TPA: PAS domain-containing sensor histidine kinase [Longimicrobiales bacterium]
MPALWDRFRTPRSEDEAAFFRQERFYKAIFRAAPSPYLILNNDSPRFTIVEVNDSYLGATNTARANIIGRALFNVFPDNPDEVSATGERNLRASLETVIRTGRPHAMAIQKYDIPRPASVGGGFEERYWTPLNTPVFNKGGRLTHIIHYVEDVTEVVRLALLRDREGATAAALRTRNEWLEAEIHRRTVAEAELDMAIERERLAREDADRARQSAEEANQYKSAFIAKMSHELRTPLNAIGGYVELLEMGLRGPVSEGQCDFLRRIRRSEEHLLALINQILDMSRLESGREHYEIGSINVKQVLLRVEELVMPQILEKKLKAAFSDCEPDLTLQADAEKVRQILLNLLSNAIKNTEPGGEISVTCEARKRHVRIYVKDSGRGIAEDQLERIFEPFIQISNSWGDGVGLGLPISRELAQGMGGELRARSKFGEGSTFILTLPRARKR